MTVELEQARNQARNKLGDYVQKFAGHGIPKGSYSAERGVTLATYQATCRDRGESDVFRQ